MMASFSKVLVATVFVASTLFAGPKIEFDTKTYKCGNFLEGKVEKLSAVFVVKNIGNAPLKLTEVRPGCGCTVVKFDSTVAPGKSTKIESSVNIKGYHSGPISKSITVSSNAENEPTSRLAIEANIQGAIDASESFINLDGTKPASEHMLFLSSQKKDLGITGVEFKMQDNGGGGPAWQKSIPTVVKYTLSPTDSVRTDGYKVYKLTIYTPIVDKSSYGSFIIKTNHPDKAEITLSGNINK